MRLRSRPPRPLTSHRGPRLALRAVNAADLLDGLEAISGSRDAGTSDGIVRSRLVNKMEFACADAPDERRLRASWKRRRGAGATALVLVRDDPAAEGFLHVVGPQGDNPVRRLRADALLGVARRAAEMRPLQAVRFVAEEVDRLDAERTAGLRVEGLGTEHLYAVRLPNAPRWTQLSDLVDGVSLNDWKSFLESLGYRLERLPRDGYLLRAGERPVAVVHPRAEAFGFARLDEEGRLPEGALLTACEQHDARFGILAAGTRLRLLTAGAQDAGVATRYLELDLAALEPGMRPLLGLLAPAYLAEGHFDEVLAEARDYGQALRKRVDRVLRQDVLPALGTGLGRWARAQGRNLTDDAVRADLEAAALLFVFRALFVLYAESAGHLPMTNPTYQAKSLTALGERAWREAGSDAAPTALWEDAALLVRRMRTGHEAWDLPAYNGELFAADAVAGAATLEQAELPDATLGPALLALCRDADDPTTGVDFSGLEVGHLGYVYEGLLSLRLSVADRDYVYDAKADRYRPAPEAAELDAAAGDLVWLTDEGGRKGGGVYYTRTDLVRHLVRGAVRPAFRRHLEDVRALAARDPAAAAEQLFDFAVLDPACGSAHFLVEVVDELADGIAELLGEVALPGVRDELEALRAQAKQYGAGINDTALLKRLVLKRCVYGVDLSPLGAEIAKLSLWLGSFVPGLSLAYLDHNIQCGNSLIGVARAEDILDGPGSGTLFDEPLRAALDGAAANAVALRRIDDTTPELVAASREADSALRAGVDGVKRLFDLWTGEALGITGGRHEALLQGVDLLAGSPNLLADRAVELATRERFLHWPIAFAEVFARERPGFDAVVGNPPWEEVKVEELGFYARYRPGVRSLADSERADVLNALMKERPELPLLFASEQERAATLRGSFGPSSGYEATVGDPDLYKLFSQRYRHLVRIGGRIGVVLPRSAFAAKGSAGFRSWLFNQTTVVRIDFLLNRMRWAFDIHPQYSVALLVAERGADTDEFEAAGVADSAASFAEQIGTPGLRLRREALGRELEIPLLSDQASADLLAKLRATGSFTLGAGQWRCFPVRELDETNDRKLWEGATEGLPLWKGVSFDQYAPRGTGERLCRDSPAARKKAAKPRPGQDALVAQSSTVAERVAAVARTNGRARVAHRLVTNRTNSRTIIACLVPPGLFLTNAAPYLAFVDDDPTAELAALAVLNSLVFDWQARRFVEMNVNFFILEGLTAPALTGDTAAALSLAAGRLSCVDERYADVAAALGIDPGPLPESERNSLRADIDARVGHAWGLTAADMDTVFADFTAAAVTPAYRQRVLARLAELS